MKKTLLFALAIISFLYTNAQEQITDLSERVTDNINFINVGIYKDHYYYILDKEIWKFNVDGFNPQLVSTLPKGNVGYFGVLLNGDVFILNRHYLDGSIVESQLLKYKIDTGDWSTVLNLNGWRYYALEDHFLYINSSSKISRINLSSKELKEELIVDDVNYLMPTKSYKNIVLTGHWSETKIRTSGFINDQHKFCEFKNGGFSLISTSIFEDLKGYKIFERPKSDLPKDYFVFDTLTSTVIQLSTLSDFSNQYVQFFQSNGRLYLLSNDLVTQTYTLYDFNNGSLKKLFEGKIETKQFSFKDLSNQSSVNADMVFSKPIIKEDILYFLGSSIVNFKLIFLVGIDLKNGNLFQKKIGENLEYDNLDPNFSFFKNRPAFVLKANNDKISIESTSYLDEIYEYSLSEKEIKKIDKPNPSFFSKISDALSIAFRNPNYLYLLLKNDTAVSQIMINEKFHYNSTIGQTIITSENLYFSDYLTKKVWIHNGTQNLVELPLSRGNEDIYEKIKQLTLIKIDSPERVLIAVNGLRKSGRNTTDLFAYDEKNKSIEELYSVDSGGESIVGWYRSPKESSFVTTILDDDIVLTDGTKDNTVKMGSISKDRYNGRIVQQLGKNTLLLQNENNLSLIKVPTLEEIFEVKNQRETGPDINGKDFYLYYDGEAVKWILKNGNIEVLARIDINEIRFFRYINYHEYVYVSTKMIGLINLLTGEHISFPFAGADFFQSEIYRDGNRILGLTEKKKEVFEFDFNSKKSRRIKTFTQPYVTGHVNLRKNRVYFIANDTTGKFSISVYSNGSIKEMVNGQMGSGSLYGKEPLLYKNSETGRTMLWNPEKEVVITLPNLDWNSVKSSSFIAKHKDYFCFAWKDRTSTISCLNTNTLDFFSTEVDFTFIDKDQSIVIGDILYLFTNNGVLTLNTETNTIQQNYSLEMERRYESTSFQFKNNLYLWAYDDLRTGQLFKLTDNDSRNVILSSENPAIHFSFYPNPTSDFLNVKSTAESSEKYTIRVFSTDGKLLRELQSTLPQNIDFSELKTGVYLINVTNSKENKTFRMIKN